MKKTGMIIKTVLSLLLVLCMMAGSIGTSAFADDISNHGADRAPYRTSDDKYNNDESYTEQSSIDKKELADEAAAAADEAVAAVNEAKEILESVDTAAVQDAVETANTAAEDAAEAAGLANAAAEKAAAVVTAAAVSAAAISTDVNEYNGEIAADQQSADEMAEQLTGSVSEAEQTIKAAVTSAAALRTEALAALEETLELDGEERVEAAKKAAEIAAEAQEVLEAAQQSKAAAEANLELAISLYNELANDTDREMSEEEIIAAVNALKGTDLDEYAQAVLDAFTAYNRAKNSFDTAAQAAEEAKGAADLALENADLKLGGVDGKAADAATKADAELNYYVNIAQAAVDAKQGEIDANNAKLGEAQKNQEAKQNDYDASIAGTTEAATQAFNAEAEAKQKKVNDAQTKVDGLQKKYNDTSRWDVFNRAYYKGLLEEAKDELADAKKKFNEFNTEAVKNSMIDKALKDSEEYKALSEAATVVETYLGTASILNGKMNELKSDLAAKKSAVENAQNTYLADIDNAEAAAREAAIAALTAQISGYSTAINQTELDMDLNDWANEFLTAINVFDWSKFRDAKAVRTYMDNTYNEEYWKSFFNRFGITQWTVGTSGLNDTMTAVIENYRELCRQAEEKKSDVIAECAKLDAAAAKKSAAELSTDAAAKKQTADEAYETLAQLSDTYSEAIANAQGSIENAKDELEAIKNKVNASLNAIDLTKLLNAITAAELKLEEAQKKVDKVQSQKNKIDAFAAFAKNYAEYAIEDGTLQTATAFAQLTAENLKATVNGLEADGNFLGFDLTTETVESRSTDYFTQASEAKKLTVSEELYKAYLDAIVAYEHDHTKGCKNSKGCGIATGTSDNKSDMPLIYWAVGADGMLTGESFTDVTKMKTGLYFLGYTFKQENDMDTVSYHIDGFYVDFEAPEKKDDDGPKDIIIVVPPTDKDGGDDDDDDKKIEDEIIPEDNEEETVDIGDEIIPEGEPDDEEIVDIDDTEVPQSDVDEVEDVLPQTGTAPVGVFVGLGAACIVLGTAVFFTGKRKETLI